MVDTGAETSDQLQIGVGLTEDTKINFVGHGWHENIRRFNCLDQLTLGHRRIVMVQPGIEKLHHAGFDDIRKPSGNNNDWFLLGHLATHLFLDFGMTNRLYLADSVSGYNCDLGEKDMDFAHLTIYPLARHKMSGFLLNLRVSPS